MPRRLRTLDCGPGKVGDTVALLGDRQPLNCFSLSFPSALVRVSRYLRTISLPDCRSMYVKSRFVSREMSFKIRGITRGHGHICSTAEDWRNREHITWSTGSGDENPSERANEIKSLFVQPLSRGKLG